MLVFIFAFTVAFLLIKTLFLYFLPFIIGIIVSFVMYPVYKFMKSKLSFKPAFSATVITLFIFAIALSILFFVCYLIIVELINLFYNNIDFFSKYINDFDFQSFLSDYNFDFEDISKISDTAFSVFRVVPLFITLLIISFVSTICIINNLPRIRSFIASKLNDEHSKKFNTVIYNANHTLKKFMKSYLFLYFLTFVESVFIFSLIDIDYVLVFAFIAAVCDVLPILGPGTVYVPIAVIKLLYGDYFISISLIIFYLITVLVRQIVEPKIVSDSIKIHPLIIFTGLYFSIVSSCIWVLFYVTLITIAYKILVESEVLKPIFDIAKDDNAKES